MKYDFSFFAEHAARRRNYFGQSLVVKDWLSRYLVSSDLARDEMKLVESPEGDRFEVNGAYFRGGEKLGPLAEAMRSQLPADFVQFYEQFGECLIITRGEPFGIYPLRTLVEDFNDDVDDDEAIGRFFVFGRYLDPIYLGLRRDDITNEWQVVLTDYGLLYEEMVGPEGRECVVAPSFYDWLKHLIETNGYPDEICPKSDGWRQLEVLEE